MVVQFQLAILSTATLNALDLMRAESPNQVEVKRWFAFYLVLRWSIHWHLAAIITTVASHISFVTYLSSRTSGLTDLANQSADGV